MKIAVFGAGAIGGLAAGKLAHAGHDPLVIARGDTLAALQADGFHIHEKDGAFTVPVRATSDTTKAGVQDVLFLGLKSHQIAGVLPQLAPLVGPETTIVPMINGVPWWYFKGTDGALADRDLESLDPSGALAEALPVAQVVGCVVYVAADCPQPGTVNSVGPRRLMLGAPDNNPANPRLVAVRTLLDDAGFTVPEVDDIRTEIWQKLWGNLFANPLSVLTGAGMADICTRPAVRQVAADMMREAKTVAGALGIDLGMDIETRIGHAAQLGGFKTSMLQDYERGRAIELDAILGAVVEIAAGLDLSVPQLETVYGLVRLRAETAGCWPGE